MPAYTIGNRELPYIEKELLVSQLKFYPKNPRVFSHLNEDEMNDPDQDTIFKHMKSTEHVKSLRLNIKVNGGLINPILVSGDVVIEGNSRLAAYKLLQEIDPVKWGKIRCHVFKEPLTDNDVFNLLCAFHVNGRKDWNPMEQAGLLFRRQQECMRPIEEIARERGMKPADAKNMVAAYELMKGNNDIETSKWSYYEEFRKIAQYVEKAEPKVEEKSIKSVILERIKDGSIAESKDLRKIGKLVRSEDSRAVKVLNQYIDGNCDIDDIEEVINDTDEVTLALKTTKKFRDLLANDKFNELIQNSDELQFLIGKIQSLITRKTEL